MINGRKVAAVMCLHFGATYIPYAMRSVADIVDEFYIMYSPVPNHGIFETPLSCPESRSDLLEAAYQVAPDRTRWFEYGLWRSEGEQFKAAWDYTDADIILKLDCDEVWADDLLAQAIEHGIREAAYEVRVPLRHYWRSFYKAFTHDPAAPGRIYIRSNADLATTYAPADATRRIHHFGYAFPVPLMRYKIGIHGHKREFTNPNWLEEVYIANRQTDCHPIGSEYWMQTSDVEPPAIMLDHPYAMVNTIE